MRASAASDSREWMHAARDGARLFIRSFEPARGRARGCVLLTHGMGEHSGRYYHVVKRLTASGVRVFTWDLRGHGRSDGKRGDIEAYELLTEDLREVYEIAASYKLSGVSPGPLFLYGHSLGGQITLNFAVAHRPRTAGLIITSPWLRLAFDPPRWKLSLARLAARFWPSFTQDTAMSPNRLSRDLDFLMAMPDPHLVHHRMSARMFSALTAGAAQALKVVKLPYPILLIHGAEDPVTSVSATEQYFKALKTRDKSLVIVPMGLHETHNDICREEVLGEISKWIEDRLPSPKVTRSRRKGG